MFLCTVVIQMFEMDLRIVTPTNVFWVDLEHVLCILGIYWPPYLYHPINAYFLSFHYWPDMK